MTELENIKIELTSNSRINEVNFDDPGFGTNFSDHMLEITYGDGQWQQPVIKEFGNLELAPSLSTLHYGQSVFEGLKAFYAGEGEINIFRLDDHYQRFVNSCERLCIPAPDFQTFSEGIKKLIQLDYQWVPKKTGQALYIRPLVFASDKILSVRVSETYTFLIMTSPVGAYYSEGFNPVSLMTTKNYVRAVEGGSGEAKTAANYATSLLPAKKAKENGFTQVLWLDAHEHRYVEEVGTMNIFFVIDDVLITPKLGGTILPGITRRSIIQLAKDRDIQVEERSITIDEVFEASEAGTLQEVFGSGTAAVVSPVGKIQHGDRSIVINDGKVGPRVRRFFDSITDIQYGRDEDKHGWITQVKI